MTVLSGFAPPALGQEPPPASVAPVIEQAERLHKEGKSEQAISLLEQRLQNLSETGADPERRALSLSLAFICRNVAVASLNRQQLPQARENFEKAIRLYTPYDRAWTANALYGLGRSLDGLSQFQPAAEAHQRALALERELGNVAGQVTNLNVLGLVYGSLGDRKKALECLEEALLLTRQSQDKGQQTHTLNNLGNWYFHAGDLDRALMYFKDMAELARSIGDHPMAAHALQQAAASYELKNERSWALEVYRKALTEARTAKSEAKEADVLHSLGDVSYRLEKFADALEYWQQALAMYQKRNDTHQIGIVLIFIGALYDILGESKQAMENLQEGLKLVRQSGDIAWELGALLNLGVLYKSLEDYPMAASYYQQTLSLAEKKNLEYEAALALTNLGDITYRRGDLKKALEYHQQGLALSRKLAPFLEPQEILEPSNLEGIAVIYQAMGDYPAALDHYQQALVGYRKAGNRTSEANALVGLMALFSDSKNRGRNLTLAIFYGKMAVDTYQALRESNRSLAEELERSYVKTVEAGYRRLADLLMDRGRLPEAEQVLGLLKAREADSVLRRWNRSKGAVEKLALSPAEKEVSSRYVELVDRVVALGSECEALEKKKTANQGTFPDSGDQAKYDRVKTEHTVASGSLKTFLETELAAAFPARDSGGERFRAGDIARSRALQTLLSQLQQTTRRKTAVVYTLVGEDSCRVILVTPSGHTSGKFAIKAEELNRKVTAFDRALRNPRLDPRPLGRELYEILVKPMERELKRAGVDTLMLSLDGTLRYLPLGALWDGKQYLVQRYRASIFSPNLTSWLGDEIDPSAPLLGLGVTGEVTVEGQTFPALPAVADEIRTIAARPTDRALLDKAFTKEALAGGIKKGFTLLHIASHFAFIPNKDSFLLLGNGERLTLSEISRESGFFSNVNLLTLSACDTARGDYPGNGRELEGLATVAQEQGAKATLATLWSVTDASTALLMKEFYRIWAANPALSKGEALRQAQLALLTGKITGAVGGPTKGVVPAEEAETAPTFTPDPQKPYAHPYYWAPFILIGNWR